MTEEANTAVQNAKSMLSGFDSASVEEKHGMILHAIAELENARNALPEE